MIEIETYLEEGHHDVLHLSADGSIDKEGKGILHFENGRGEEIEVTGTELLEVLKPTPNIIILSACHSARKEPELMSVAHTLFKGGINTIIGMKQSISNDAAIEFNIGFFKALLKKETVKNAFDAGKEAILKWEQWQMRENREWQFKEEHQIPELLTRNENLTIDNFSDFRIEAPGRPESHYFMGARYLERGFIGRRQVLRDIFKSIDNKEGALVLKGPGGIGKSTLTTRTAANLSRKGYEFIVVQGDTTIEQILDAICKKAAALEVKGAEKIYEANAEPNEKVAWYLDQFLLKQKVVLILDNFEENQEEEKAGAFKRERLKDFLWFFRDGLKHHDTFLMFSTRYALPGFDSPDITRNIPEFSSVEFRKMLLNSKALKSLDSTSVKTLMEEIGGNPRALDLLDSIAYEEFKQHEFTREQLRDLFPEMRERIIDKKEKGDEFTPLFLDRLFSYLSELQRQLLDVLSIYRNPVPVEAITAQNVSMKRQDRRKLVDLSLLECFDLEDKELHYVHRLTALYLLEQMKAAKRKGYHQNAARYFEALKTKDGKVFVEDHIESRWHYLQAGEWNKAAEITFSLEAYLRLRGYPQWAMELLQELEIKKLNDENQYITNGKLGSLYEDFGEYDNALFYYNKSLKISEKNDDSRDIAINLHNIGMIYQYKGDYEAALTHYQKSIDINEKIGDIAGTASSIGQMGKVLSIKGQHKNALKLCIQSYLIFVKLESPNAKIVKGFINNIRKKLHKEQFNAILEEFNLSLDAFDKTEAEEQKQFLETLTAITKDAVSASASEKSSDEKEKLVAMLNLFIEKLPDAPEAEGLKNYFQLLLAVVNGEAYHGYLEKVPEELKELFEKAKDESA